MAPVQRDVRLFEEIERLIGETELLVPEPVVAELDALADEGGAAGTAASVGRDLVDRCRVAATDATYADDAVVELASTPIATIGGTSVGEARDSVDDGSETRERVVVTMDEPLRDRLAARGVRVIGLSSGNTLRVIEP